MAWQGVTYSVGKEYGEDDDGNVIDLDADIDAGIPTEYELPIESLTEVANHPELLEERLVRVPNIYELNNRNDTSALS